MEKVLQNPTIHLALGKKGRGRNPSRPLMTKSRPRCDWYFGRMVFRKASMMDHPKFPWSYWCPETHYIFSSSQPRIIKNVYPKKESINLGILDFEVGKCKIGVYQSEGKEPCHVNLCGLSKSKLNPLFRRGLRRQRTRMEKQSEGNKRNRSTSGGRYQEALSNRSFTFLNVAFNPIKMEHTSHSRGGFSSVTLCCLYTTPSSRAGSEV